MTPEFSKKSFSFEFAPKRLRDEPKTRAGCLTMKKACLLRLVVILLAAVIFAPPSWGQTKVRINWSSVTGWMSGIWLAYEEGIFKKNDLEVELLHIPGASRAISALVADEISFSSMDFQTAMQAYLNGADVVVVVGGGNRLPVSLLARPEIKKVSDLKDKKIGVARLGSLTYTAIIYIVNKAGLTPRDYQMLALVNQPNILNALLGGQIEAGVLASPGSIRARKAGFNELVNLLKDGPEYPAWGIGTTSRYIRANQEITRRVVRSYVEAVHLFKNNKRAAVRVLQKYTKLNDADILEETYKEVAENLEGVPYVNRDGLALILANMEEFAAKETQPKLEKFLDMRFVGELEKEGLFKKRFGDRY
jgi:NitT/TauT family transport system substrate-binding protein